MIDFDVNSQNLSCCICEDTQSSNKCSICKCILCDNCYYRYFTTYKYSTCPLCRKNFHYDSDNIFNNINIIIDHENYNGILHNQRNRNQLYNLFKKENYTIQNIMKSLIILLLPFIFVSTLYLIGWIISKFILKVESNSFNYVYFYIGLLGFFVIYVIIIIPIWLNYPHKCDKLIKLLYEM